MPNEAALRAQARTFAAYLGSAQIPAEVAERFAAAVADWDATSSRFDRWLAGFAARHSVLTALADAYARIAQPYGDLRRRLTLTLALLESHGATHVAYDRAAASHQAVAWLALGISVAAWALRTVVAIVLLAPVHAVASLTRTSGGR